ncbi:hypothetical protein FFLO_02071 [Filobasidium floriforme]|uniref:Uncharacterized protein n=1 Tax=Filobasidium floriforme TaxID=5210 RepID=A0A8K0JP14_9TREE|nr:hypothetical protein FFLO_02071 [Filobasidium floriforme]
MKVGSANTGVLREEAHSSWEPERRTSFGIRTARFRWTNSSRTARACDKAADQPFERDDLVDPRLLERFGDCPPSTPLGLDWLSVRAIQIGVRLLTTWPYGREESLDLSIVDVLREEPHSSWEPVTRTARLRRTNPSCADASARRAACKSLVYSHMTVRSAIQSKPPLEDVASGREEVSVSTHPLPTDRGSRPCRVGQYRNLRKDLDGLKTWIVLRATPIPQAEQVSAFVLAATCQQRSPDPDLLTLTINHHAGVIDKGKGHRSRYTAAGLQRSVRRAGRPTFISSTRSSQIGPCRPAPGRDRGG